MWLHTADKPAEPLLKAFQTLARSRRQPEVAPEPEADWIRLSQRALAPVDAGRFHVHTGDQPGGARPGQIAIRIDAGLAFGTGQHATTRGCLAAIDRLSRRRFAARILDIGTGTGVLAIAAARADRRARVSATDIDPVAIKVARANARLNRAPGIRFKVGAGLPVAVLRTLAPFDLVLANILMGPLLGLAEGLRATVRPGGVLVLAGLLASQRRAVEAAYVARGFRIVATRAPQRTGEWPILTLVRRGRPRRIGHGVAVRASRRGTGASLRSAGTI